MGVEDKTAGRFAYDGLERVIHEKARLGILSSLATHGEGLLFNDLKELCANGWESEPAFATDCWKKRGWWKCGRAPRRRWCG